MCSSAKASFFPTVRATLSAPVIGFPAVFSRSVILRLT
ncbi:hypothetical protein EV648_11038 [Kribbella sp. VKM Ac-2568]|nr:hypothetical protein EV648_11038 [Kribbella sp. VKM Ac-2568]